MIQMEDYSGIDEELEAQGFELEELFSEYVVLGETPRGLRITGIALAEGVWKGVLYSKDELAKYFTRLKGLPIKIEHGKSREFGDLTVGKVTKVLFNRLLNAILFEGLVTDKKAIKLIKNGELKAVSCSTWMEKKDAGQNVKIGEDYRFQELSLVSSPACEKCFLFGVEQLSMVGKDLNNSNEKETNIITKGEEEMQNQEEILEAPKLYAILQLPDEESLTNLRQNKKVAGYYYGYPYGCPFRYGYYPYGYYKTSSCACEDEDEKYKEKEEMSYFVLLELDSPEELMELKKVYKVKKYYYGYPHGKSGIVKKYHYGKYPYYKEKDSKKYPGDKYYYGYPGYEGKYKKPEKKEALESQGVTEIKELPDAMKRFGSPKGPSEEGINPNADQCAEEIECPIDGEKFKTAEEFGKHWDEKHKEKYGVFKEMSEELMTEDLAAFRIKKMKNGRFIVFKITGKKGFGAFKIMGNFATQKEAEDFVHGKGEKEENRKEEENLSQEPKKEEVKPPEVPATPAPAPAVSAPVVETPKVETPKVEEPKVEPPKVEEKKPEATIVVRIEQVPVPAPLPPEPETPAPEVKAPEAPKEEPKEEPKVEVKTMTEEELLKELHGKAAEIILRYSKKTE